MRKSVKANELKPGDTIADPIRRGDSTMLVIDTAELQRKGVLVLQDSDHHVFPIMMSPNQEVVLHERKD